VIDTDPGGEALDRIGRRDGDLSDRVGAQTAVEFPLADRQGRPDDRSIALECLVILPDELKDDLVEPRRRVRRVEDRLLP